MSTLSYIMARFHPQIETFNVHSHSPYSQIIIPLSQSCDAMAVKCLEPRGILFVHLKGASNLPSKGGMRKMFGQADPDGYAKVCFGAAESKETSPRAGGLYIFFTFLDASFHLYKRVCPSVRRSVRPSVRRSVRNSFVKGGK